MFYHILVAEGGRRIMEEHSLRLVSFLYHFASIYGSNKRKVAQAMIKLRKKAKIRNRQNKPPHLTQDTVWESDKTQENITYKRAKRSALSQQVTTRLQEIDKAVSYFTCAERIQKFCQRGSSFDSVFLVDERIQIPL